MTNASATTERRYLSGFGNEYASEAVDGALPQGRNNPQRAPFDEIIARYLKSIGDPREVVRDPEARYFGGRVDEHSLVPLGEARLGRIGLDEWLRSQKTAD